MRYFIAALLLTAALPLSAFPTAAQGILPFTVEARAGMAFPVDEFASGVEAGFLLEATAKLSPLPFATLYGGWSYAVFAAEGDAGVAGLDSSVRDSGLRFGGEVSAPLAGLAMGVAPYLQAGILINRAEIRVQGDATNTLGGKSERTRGFELGTGVRVTLARRIAIVPEIRYRSYDPEFDVAPTIDIANELSYVAASLGVTFHF
jgi:opacity protein-like surface antigen